jgi:hypothetical protein
MSQPSDPINDPKRLAALRRTGLLDSPPEEAFDCLALAASEIMNASVALVSLVGDDRQFFKSAQGPGGVFQAKGIFAAENDTTLAMSLCRYAVAAVRPLVISDARLSPDFQDHPAVRNGGIVAYAGMPIVVDSGEAIGTVCVLDHKPHDWSEQQLAALGELAREASELIARQATTADSKARLFARKTGLVAAPPEAQERDAASGVVALIGRMETPDSPSEPAAPATAAKAEQGLVAAALFFLRQVDAYVLSLGTRALGGDSDEQNRLRAAVVGAQASLFRALEAFDAADERSASRAEAAAALRNSCAVFLEADVVRMRTSLLFRRGETSMEQVERSVLEASAAEQAVRLALRDYTSQSREGI